MMGDAGNKDAVAATPGSARVVLDARPFRTIAADRFGLRRTRRIVWAVLCLVLAGFVAFGRVTIYVADGDERRLSIIRVWQLLGNGLPSVDHASLMNAVFISSLVVVIVTSLAALWLALVSVGPTAAEVGAIATTDDDETLAATETAVGRDRP